MDLGLLFKQVFGIKASSSTGAPIGIYKGSLGERGILFLIYSSIYYLKLIDVLKNPPLYSCFRLIEAFEAVLGR